MWKCGNCGKENRDDRNHCYHCSTARGVSNSEGSSVLQRVETNNPLDKTSICPQCSGALDDDAKFCPSCAAPVLPNVPLNCPKCAKLVSAAVKFCKYCAADLSKKEEYTFAPRESYSDPDFFEIPQMAKADKLALAGGITAAASALAALWGYTYTSSLYNSGVAVAKQLAGQTDSTYTLAQFCITFGFIGFIIGVVLLIIGLSQR